MINRVSSYDNTSFRAKLKISDKSNILSQNSVKKLTRIAKDLGSSADSIKVDLFQKNRIITTPAGYPQIYKEPQVIVINHFDSTSWENGRPDAFLKEAYKEFISAPAQDNELNAGNIVFTVLKDYLHNFLEYNNEFITKDFKSIKHSPIAVILEDFLHGKAETFKISDGIESIRHDNIEKLIPLYRKYQEGMNQVVDEGALREYIEKIITNNNKIFIITENNRPCGFLHFSVSHSTIDMQPFTTIQSLFVDENFRQQGFAQRLIREVENWTEYMNFKGISVKTNAKNPASVGLYNSQGFISEENKYAIFFRPNSKVLDYNKGYVNTKEEDLISH